MSPLPLYVLDVAMEIDREAEFLGAIEQALDQRRTVPRTQ
jgi:hypothetical protein